jgi:hypothetical protein
VPTRTLRDRHSSLSLMGDHIGDGFTLNTVPGPAWKSSNLLPDFFR